MECQVRRGGNDESGSRKQREAETLGAKLDGNIGIAGRNKVTKGRRCSTPGVMNGGRMSLGRGSFYEARNGPTLPTRIRRKVARK